MSNEKNEQDVRNQIEELEEFKEFCAVCEEKSLVAYVNFVDPKNRKASANYKIDRSFFPREGDPFPPPEFLTKQIARVLEIRILFMMAQIHDDYMLLKHINKLQEYAELRKAMEKENGKTDELEDMDELEEIYEIDELDEVYNEGVVTIDDMNKLTQDLAKLNKQSEKLQHVYEDLIDACEEKGLIISVIVINFKNREKSGYEASGYKMDRQILYEHHRPTPFLMFKEIEKTLKTRIGLMLNSSEQDKTLFESCQKVIEQDKKNNEGKKVKSKEKHKMKGRK